MTPSANCYRMIAGFEGYCDTAYRDARGRLTIGYGHTGPDVTVGMTCTAAEAERWLRLDVAWAAECVTRHVTASIGQNQFDALTSFTFNVGATAFEESTLLRELNDGEYEMAADEFLKWSRAGSDRSLLLPRRAAERALFLTPDSAALDAA